MAKIPFIVSARAGKLLGRENFSNPEGAIIELVKNSYDADAKNCIVIFDVKYDIIKDEKKKTEKKVINKNKSHIFIIDNGEGMTDAVIKDYWMKIGTGNKEFDYISDENRVKTGAKGIGRFALDRLGSTTEMWTLSKKTKNNIGFYWEMDWKQFDNSDKAISEINANIESQSIHQKELLQKAFPENSNIERILQELNLDKGTILKISNLKDEWFNIDIESVFKSLEALIPPKELKIPFEVYFHHIQQPKEYGQVETAFFNDYDYKVIAKYNAKTLNVDFEITRNELDLEIVKKKFSSLYANKKSPYDLKTLEKKTFKYSKKVDSILKWKLNENNIKLLNEVGSFNLIFYYLKYSVSKKEGYPYKSINIEERRAALSKFGGVKVYRDSFRVRPYGDIGNDWLSLGARRAKSPAGAGQRIGDWRVGPESTAGTITISRKTNPLLVDKSDRGALQENNAFNTFKKIITGLIHEFEIDRTKTLNPYYLYKKEEAEKELEKKIHTRAVELAQKIADEQKKSDEKYYGKKPTSIDLFAQKKEEEEKKSYEKAFKETFQEIEDENLKKEYEEVAQVRSLASLGLIFSSFAHELKEIRDNTGEINLLEKNFKKIVSENFKKIALEEQKKLKENKQYNSEVDNPYQDGVDIIELLKEDSKKIKYWVNYSLTAIKKDKRKRKALDFSKFFISLNKNWKRILDDKNITLKIDDNLKDSNYNFRGFEMDLNTIFANLINNAIDSFNELDVIKDRIIAISVKKQNDSMVIIFSDNGVGLSSVFEEKEDIYLPFTTSKKDNKGNEIGTGLGMYLVKNVVDDNNGKIEILESKSGFGVKINFPLRKQQKI